MSNRLIKFVLNTIPRKYLILGSYVFRKISQNFYKGDKVECPICAGHFRKFLPYGYDVVRNNALCPRCLSLERHRLIWLYLKENTSFFESTLKVLHIAPEQCFRERFINMPNLNYITADLESPIADYKCDVQNLPFDQNEFDVVICNHVFEHVDDDALAMNEIFRVMKPGAFAILLVPINFELKETYEDRTITSQKERTKHFGQYDHWRVYGLDYPERVKKAGFLVPSTNFLNEINDELIIRYGLPSEEFMYAYQKPHLD